MKERKVDSSDNILSFPDRSRLQEAAGIWLAKLDNGQLTQDEATALREWLNKDPDNKKVLLELARLWKKMEVLSELSDLFPLSRTGHKHSNKTVSRPIFSLRPAAGAVSVFVLAALLTYLGIAFNRQNPAHPAQLETVYTTMVGEQAVVSLPDGSDTTLNTDSVVDVAYNEAQRNIRLVRGEAHFNVDHNDARPFVVHAGTGIIRAVGTAFSVHLKGEDVEVVVTEGSVEIASSVKITTDAFIDVDEIEPSKFLTTINAGQSAEYGSENIHSVLHIEPELMSRKLSWQHGMLVFEGNLLEEVVAEISRYTNTEIIINDRAIRSIRVGGYFRTGETEALLTVLEENFHIHVERVSENLVYLSGAKLKQAAREQ